MRENIYTDIPPDMQAYIRPLLMLCRDRSLVHEYEGGKCAIPLCCRSWNCDYCAPRRRRDVIMLAAAGQPNRMVTITVNPSVLATPDQRAKALANAWRLVVKRARRAFGWTELNYLAVFERTKRGEPHLHILCRCGFLPQAWLSAQLKELIGAPIVDVRKVTSEGNAARYVAKYIGKDPHRFGTTKRYWYTPGWVKKDPAKQERSPLEPRRWRIVDEPLWHLHDIWKRDILRPPQLDDDLLWSGLPPPWWQPFLKRPKRAPNNPS